MPDKLSKNPNDITQQWVKEFVIKLNLCPFAANPLLRQRVKFLETEADDEEALLNDLVNEVEFLDHHEKIETTLLTLPHILNNFDDFNQFLDKAETMISLMGKEGVYQLASFHPQYQFAGTHLNDAGNFTNRSPYPILQLLREVSLDKAIKAYGDTTRIPVNNIDTMESLGFDKLSSELAAYLDR